MAKTELSVNLEIKGIGETRLSMNEAKKLYEELKSLFQEKVVYHDNRWWWAPYWYGIYDNPYNQRYQTWCDATKSAQKGLSTVGDTSSEYKISITGNNC